MIVSEKMYELGSKRSAIRELFEYGKKRAAEIGTENVYDFSLGNPTVPAPECVNETIRELTKELDSVHLHGYTSAQGDLETRQAVADYLNKTYQTAFKADNFYMTMGAAASLSLCFKALTTDSEGEFITIAPFFPEYKQYVNRTGAVLKVVPADTEQFQINFEALESMINENTAVILINTPNNPSGTVYSTQTLTRLAQLLNDKQKEYGHDIFVVSDEPYREIVFEGVDAPYVSKFYDNTLSCYSYSKSLSLPGERIGYVAANPKCTDSELISVMCSQISRGIGHNCPPSIIQIAVSEVLGETADLSVYETNMNLIYKELMDLGFTCVKPGGTFYIFPKALEEDAVAFCQKALKYDLVLVPSDSFGCPGFVRMAYCIDTEKVQRSLAALRKFVETEYPDRKKEA